MATLGIVSTAFCQDLRGLRVSGSGKLGLAAKGAFLAHAEGDALKQWDKLKVLEELWEPEASHKPVLFYVPLIDLVGPNDEDVRTRLAQDPVPCCRQQHHGENERASR
jgi:hypothetical protein